MYDYHFQEYKRNKKKVEREKNYAQKFLTKLKEEEVVQKKKKTVLKIRGRLI